MPQCICGRHFKPLSYNVDGRKEDDLCPCCKASSTPSSYINSYEWVGDETTFIIEHGDRNG